MTAMSCFNLGAYASGTGSAGVITISNTLSSDTKAGELVRVAYRIDTDGYTYTVDDDSVEVQVEQWVDPTSANNDFEVRATEVSYTNNGSTASGNFGTWEDLVSDQTWALTQVTPGAASTRVFDIEIRDKVTQTVRDTARITLDAERSS